jgi:L-gulono-1,4-lactone dehydrogenase
MIMIFSVALRDILRLALRESSRHTSIHPMHKASSSARPVRNFGENVEFTPEYRYAPKSEAELLDILRLHSGRKIRAVGRLHAWSAAAACSDVLVDLRHLDRVTIHCNPDDPSQVWAEVGAGSRIKHLLAELHRYRFTMPSLGLITEQTIAGAAATGTHGSGRHSISHYLQGVRLATYDPKTGEPTIRSIDEGDELRAARCSLGSLGLVTSVKLPIRPCYLVEEHFRRYAHLADVLAAEESYDLQQFYLIPWRWDYFAQHRREVPGPRSLLAPLYRLYWSVGMDVLFHLVVCALARRLPASWTRIFCRHVASGLIPRGWKVADRSDHQLTMQHQLFRHIEIEIFVTRSKLAEATEFVGRLLRHAGGEEFAERDALRSRLESIGLGDRFEALRGCYTHHYPICIRKVLPDDTLISPASGSEPWYALSFISYALPNERAGFFTIADVMARTLARLFGGRPHWGKYCPLDPAEAAQLYPRFKDFCALVHSRDSEGRFRNEWTEALFGEPAPATQEIA